MGLGWGVPPMGGGGYPPSQGFSFFVIGLDRKILNTPDQFAKIQPAGKKDRRRKVYSHE